MKQGNLMSFLGKKKDNKEVASTPSKADQLQPAKESDKKIEEEIVKVNGGNSNSKGKDIAISEEKKTKNTAQQLQ